MNKYWQSIYVVIALILGLSLATCANEGRIRAKLLVDTPIGSSFEEVLAFCERRKLKCAQSSTAGYLNQDTGKGVGVRSILTVINERKYTPFTITSISAFWGFDQDGKLLDIWIWKTTDAP